MGHVLSHAVSRWSRSLGCCGFRDVFWVRRDFVFFQRFFFERTRPAASMRPPCLIYLSTSALSASTSPPEKVIVVNSVTVALTPAPTFQCISPFMRLADHLTTLRAWYKQAMSAWSVETRRAPSRHCKDARVYGHTATVMHDMSIAPPLPAQRVDY